MRPNIFVRAPESDASHPGRFSNTSRQQILRNQAQIDIPLLSRLPGGGLRFHLTEVEIAQVERQMIAFLRNSGELPRQDTNRCPCPRHKLTPKTFSKSTSARVLESGTCRCPICFEDNVADPAVIVSCGHMLCIGCLRGMRKHGGTMKCPFCRGEMIGYVFLTSLKDVQDKEVRAKMKSVARDCLMHKWVEGRFDRQDDVEQGTGVQVFERLRKWCTRWLGI
jgi:hypothetical protein